jgi:hypothetical protein
MDWTRTMYKNIHEAAERNDVDAVKGFLDSGVKVNVTRNKWTPLVTAAVAGHRKIVELLIDRGATIDKPCGDRGWTALMAAAINGRTPVCRMLINEGASVHAKDPDGNTVLMLAAGSGLSNRATLEHLLERRALIDEQDQDGGTPLIHATAAGLPSHVEFLLRKGARMDIEDKNGDRAFHHAIRTIDPFDDKSGGYCKKRLLQIFVDHGEDPGGRMPDGRTYSEFLEYDHVLSFGIQNQECAAMLRAMAARRAVEMAIESVSKLSGASKSLR